MRHKAEIRGTDLVLGDVAGKTLCKRMVKCVKC